jgi:glycine cleavage system protein P-like pyridoxal-binding family
MNPTKADALQSLRPGAEWVLRGDDLEWLDQVQTEPTEAEIQAELDRLIADQPRKIAQQQRAAAYTTEADPLFFKAQRGEATIEEWQAKVAEIRSRYPYPQEAES